MHLSTKNLTDAEMVRMTYPEEDFAVEDAFNDDTYTELKEEAERRMAAALPGHRYRYWRLKLYIEHRAARERGQVV